MSSLQEECERLSRVYPDHMRASLVLPLLHAAQEQGGHVSRQDADTIARCAGVPPMQVMEALSWYTMFFREPAGRHVIKVCRNIVCSLRGAERLMCHLERRLGIRFGESTADGRVTLLAVECLASCGSAPSMQVNQAQHDYLSEETIDRILAELR